MKMKNPLLEKLPREALTGVQHYDNGLSRDPYNLQSRALKVGEEYWTLEDLTQGWHGFGGSGSGKSRGMIRTLGHALRGSELALGGIYCCVKADASADAQEMMEECGAGDRAYVMGEGSPLKINIVDYISKRFGGDERILVSFISNTAQKMAQTKGDDEAGSFWRDKADSVLYNTITVLKHGQEEGARLGMEEIHLAVNSAPTEKAQVADEAWRKDSFWFQCFNAADHKEYTSARDRNDWRKCKIFWQQDYIKIPEKTLMSVLTTLNLLLEGLTRGVFFETFNTETNITPEITWLEPDEYKAFCEENGFECVLHHESGCGTIIMDYSEKTHMELGLAVQNLLRTVWQRAIEERMKDTGRQHRPSFCFADESHYLVTESDYKFASTARSAKAIQIFASQSVDNYIATLGERKKNQVYAFLSDFQTHCFLNNASIGETNSLSSQLLGKHWVPIPHSGTVGGRQTTGVSYQLIDKVEATEFGLLRRPSRQMPSCEGFIYRTGAEFMSNYCPTCGRGENFLKVTFDLV